MIKVLPEIRAGKKSLITKASDELPPFGKCILKKPVEKAGAVRVLQREIERFPGQLSLLSFLVKLFFQKPSCFLRQTAQHPPVMICNADLIGNSEQSKLGILNQRNSGIAVRPAIKRLNPFAYISFDLGIKHHQQLQTVPVARCPHIRDLIVSRIQGSIHNLVRHIDSLLLQSESQIIQFLQRFVVEFKCIHFPILKKGFGFLP